MRVVRRFITTPQAETRPPITLPEMYERWLVASLFRPFAEALLDRVGLRSGEHVLDVACGTGIVARLARGRAGAGARIVGVDLSPQMLAVARNVAPDIDWREGNATELPVAAGETFDVVLCQQGLQFFPDRPAAARAMHRVLAPSGRLGVATWRPLDDVPFFAALHRIAERHVGPVVDQRHAFGIAGDLERLLGEAGFHDVRVETVTRTVRFPEPAVFLQLNAMAIVGMSAAAKTMDDAERARTIALVANDSADVLPDYRDGSELAFALATNVATARA